MKTDILVIDDDREFCSLIKDNLEKTGDFEVFDCFSMDGFESNGFKDTRTFFTFLNKKTPHLIILDLSMKGIGGFDICKSLKQDERFASIPVIIVSARSDDVNKVSGLDMGADDYVVKPFSLQELTARVKSVLRRIGINPQEDKLKIAKVVTIDVQKRRVLVKGQEIKLTPTEFVILEILSSNKGRVFPREKILDYLWGSPRGALDRTVDVHIRHLRKKLGEVGKVIKSVRTFGYMLEENP
jgi:DNA-binding response OmpR family regulator